MSFDLPLDRMDWQAFRNDSGEVVPAFGIMAITGVLVRDDDALLTIDKPSVTFCWQYAVNGEAEVSVGGYGNCTLSSPCAQYYDTGTPAAKEGWGPKPGQWTLSKGFPATTIVNGIADATNKILFGSFSEITTALIRFTGSVSNNTSTTTYKIYAGTMGSEADAGFTTVPSARNRTGARVTNDWALLVRVNNGWEIANLEGTTGSSEIYHITVPSPGVAANATISITLPTTEVVTAKNWSACTMDTGDKVTIYKDGDDDNWYLDKSGNCGASGTRWFLATLTGNLSSDSGSSTDIGSVIALDDGSVPTITEALNTFALTGVTGDELLICEYAAAAEGYLITQITHKTREMVVDITRSDLTVTKSRRSITFLEGSGTANDTAVLTFELSTFVSEVFQSGTNFYQTKCTVIGLDDGTEPPCQTVLWASGTECTDTPSPQLLAAPQMDTDLGLYSAGGQADLMQTYYYEG